VTNSRSPVSNSVFPEAYDLGAQMYAPAPWRIQRIQKLPYRQMAIQTRGFAARETLASLKELFEALAYEYDKLAASGEVRSWSIECRRRAEETRRIAEGTSVQEFGGQLRDMAGTYEELAAEIAKWECESAASAPSAVCDKRLAPRDKVQMRGIQLPRAAGRGRSPHCHIPESRREPESHRAMMQHHRGNTPRKLGFPL
jgi:hypothetical protein